VFRAAKRPVLCAIRDNSLGYASTDAGKFFQLLRRCGVDVYERGLFTAGQNHAWLNCGWRRA
jgi:hypothetical protein